MSELPLAVRIAAGLAATAVERARKLPQDLAELPITAASRAMQASMRLQQGLTDLAIKGDNVIATLRTPAEDPPWAVFDEDLDDGDQDHGVTPQEAARDWYDEEYAETAGSVASAEPAVELDDALAETDGTAAEPLHTPTETLPTAAETHHTPAETLHTAAETLHTPTETRHTPGGGPGVLPGYPGLSLASMRARLRTLGVEDLEALLVYEQANENRAEFIRMLTNRISTVRDQ